MASEGQILGPIQSMMAAADVENDSGVPYTITSVDEDPTDHAWLVVKGTFQPPNFLNERNELVLDGNTALLQGAVEDRPSYPFTVFVPHLAQTTSELPLVVIDTAAFRHRRELDLRQYWSWCVRPGLADAGPLASPPTGWAFLGRPRLIISDVVPDIARINCRSPRPVAHMHIAPW